MSYGLRAGTRYKFAKKLRQHGHPNLTRYLTVFRRGDYVDVKVDSAIQKGMPYHTYHGKTGIVYDVTPRSVGVRFAKRVRQREILKSFHIRIEHVRKNRGQAIRRAHRVAHQELVEEWKKNPVGDRPRIFQKPEGPKRGEIVIPDSICIVEPQCYECNI